MPEPTLALEEDPLEENISEATPGLVHFNDTQAVSLNQRQLGLIVRDGGAESKADSSAIRTGVGSSLPVSGWTRASAAGESGVN